MENETIVNYSNDDIRALYPPKIIEISTVSKSKIFSEILVSKYSYNVEQSEQSELELITNEILQLKNNVAENTIVLGMKLIQVKENIGRGNWLPYLEGKVDFTPRTANRFMKLAKEYGNTNKTSMSYLEPTKMIILLDLPSIEREQFVLENNVENMSCRELTKAIKEIKDIKNAQKKAARINISGVIVPEVIEQHYPICEGLNITTIEEVAVKGELDTLETIANKGIEDTITITKSQLNHIKFDVSIKTRENIEMSLLEDKVVIDTEKVLKKADDLIKEIKVRTGGFYTQCNSTDDVKCDDRGGILGQLFATGEITQEELLETIKAYSIDLEINYKELLDGTLKDNYIANICNSYNQYDSNNSTCYLSITNKEMCYENVVEFVWEKNETDRLNLIKDATDLFAKDNITITRGYDDCTAQLCVYRDRELLGYYDINTDNNLQDVTKLFKFYKIDKCYLDLVKSFIELIKSEQLEQKNKIYADIKSKAKFINYQEIGNIKYTFILIEKPYSNMGDRLYIFKDVDKIGEVTLEDQLGEDNFDIELDHNKNLLKLLKKVDKKCWNRFKETISIENLRLFKIRRAKEGANKKQWEKESNDSYKKYSSGGYDFSGMLGKSIIKEEEKPLYKKFYKTLALNYHPDKIGGTGEEMKVINQLKTTWGI